MHTKDLADSKAKESQVDVGDGVLPIVAIFQTASQMNYTGGVMLEYEINVETRCSACKKAWRYERGVMAALKDSGKENPEDKSGSWKNSSPR